jgi:threonine/homoserine/homoserine lactone efflux protein
LKPLIIYVITALISYVATIPPGPLSVYVVHTTLQKNIKMAMWVAFGGVLCESAYSYLATAGVFVFDKYPAVAMAMKWGIIGLLVLVGTITFFQKPAPIKTEEVSAKGRGFSFFKGISLSLFNPQLIAFWVVVLLAYNGYDFLKINTLTERISFVLGAGTGTFGLVYTYAYIANRKRDFVFKYLNDSRLNKLIGVIFWSLALVQLVNLLS